MAKAHTVTTKHALLLTILADAHMQFIVEAGKYDGSEENCKYSSEVHATYDEALADLARVSDYPWSRIRIYNEELAQFRMAKHAADARAAAQAAPRPRVIEYLDYSEYVAACRAHAKAARLSTVTYATREQFLAAHGA